MQIVKKCKTQTQFLSPSSLFEPAKKLVRALRL